MERTVQEKYGPTLCAIRSYKSIGFFSREYAILRSKEILEETILEFESKSETEKEKFLSKVNTAKLLTYRELFEKLMLSIEDLAAIFYALTFPLEDFAVNITKEPKITNVFSKITDEKIRLIFKYGNVSDYEEDEFDIVKKYRDRFIEVCREYLNIILQFYEINKKAYIRMKHGNSLFYTTDTVKIEGIDTFVIPVQYNTKVVDNVDVLLLNEYIYEKMYKLFNFIQELSRVLCDINEEYVLSGEKHHPVGLIVEPLDQVEKEKIEAIIQKYSVKQYIDVNTMLNIKANLKKIDKIMDFYKKIPS